MSDTSNAPQNPSQGTVQNQPVQKQQPKEQAANKGGNKLWIALGVLAVLIIGTVIYVILTWGRESTDDANIDGRMVTLAPKVSGYVKTLNVDDNTMVKAGDVLLEIDPTDYLNARDKAVAALAAAQAAASASISNFQTTNIQLPSNIDAAQAQVDAQVANLQKAVADLKRMRSLSAQARSQEQLDQAVAVEKTAESNLEDAKARLRSAETAPRAIAAAKANAEQLAAQVKGVEADLAQAEKNLSDTKLIAPMDGRITRRQVERGDFVQAGQQLAQLVGNDIWITANFKEIQLKDMKPGQRVKVKIDAYPKLDIEGKVDSIQSGTGAFFSAFPPQNATGNFVKIVQRVPVKILIEGMPDDQDIVLGPGLSVEPTVYTAE